MSKIVIMASLIEGRRHSENHQKRLAVKDTMTGVLGQGLLFGSQKIKIRNKIVTDQTNKEWISKSVLQSTSSSGNSTSISSLVDTWDLMVPASVPCAAIWWSQLRLCSTEQKGGSTTVTTHRPNNSFLERRKSKKAFFWLVLTWVLLRKLPELSCGR